MSLFQNSVLNKYLKGLESEKVNQAYERFTSHFHNPTIQENIRNSKEEQYQGEFLIDLFVNVFGYVKNPTPDFNLTTELKNIKGSKKTDGAILKGEKALAVIELKGTNTTDLSKVETQAFGYKNNQPGCNYVITSNFEKLRFYIDNAVDFEEFNLFQLTKERFNILWLCLSSEYLLKDIPKKIKDESLTQEEKITKELYKDYASFRNEVFDSIQKENPQYDKLTLFKKTQKLLDRFLFIFFAEDRLLLPPNSIRSIVNQWTDLKDKYDEYFPLYDRFQKYFGYMNSGYKGQQHDIFAYNGGLFAPDEILDNIKINDELLYKHTVNLSNYDFESEVSVNILGHIFEHSLNDIDEIQAEIQGVSTEQSKTKRKKDGVFYTPKYITKYIVDNTVGKLCEEKKIELDIQEAEYEKERKGRKKATLKNLTQKLEDYRKWLLQITICDPACGSGAFLNQALEFLISEHQYIDELQAKLFGDAMVLSEVENAILENNIYGVDINDESVEIAKLSLWLRTAQKGRKLTSLNNNIKCGNSLIDDPTFAGEKAFNWNNEFPEVFSNGGFDVIIGNPPYVRHEIIKEFKPSFQKDFETYLSTADLYVYFIELGIKALKTNGLLGFINPNKFIKASYGKNLKQFLSKLQIEKLIDFGELNIFQDAVTSPLILIISNKAFDYDAKYLQIQTLKNLDIDFSLTNEGINLKPEIFQQEKWNLISEKELSIINKVQNNGISIADNKELDIKYGLKTGYNDAFIISDEVQKNIITKDPKSAELIKKFIDGDDVRKFEIRSKGKHLICIPSGYTDLQGEFENENDAWFWLKTNFSGIAEFLEPFKEKAKKRSDKGKYWWELRACDYYNLIDNPKIIYPEIAMSSRFAFDEESTYINKTIFLINSSSLSLLGLLNSKLIWYYLMNICASLGDPKNGGRLNMQRIYLETISFPEHLIIESSDLTEPAKTVRTLYTSLNKKINRFRKRILNTESFGIDKLSKKLNEFYDYDFKTFLAELKKKKITLSLSQQDEWEEYFDEYNKEINELKSRINGIENEIDNLIYKHYELTEEEIKIVENANA
ncbi:Eco57I restriction-modification methylase domain-containing protein [Maribacter sp.]|uniref:Eco57I restriction-modification methylase domain-containing protein n=1 Tax=Maribacter sp. TaxID=1897614 RepID=UPI0025BF1848|nr:DNA methyltransferase [Maribacter sp.]